MLPKTRKIGRWAGGLHLQLETADSVAAQFLLHIACSARRNHSQRGRRRENGIFKI
jgi:hypothetical protein